MADLSERRRLPRVGLGCNRTPLTLGDPGAVNPDTLVWGGGGSQWGRGTTCLCSFAALAAQKWKFPKLIFFDIMTIHNDQISYAKPLGKDTGA